MIKCEICDKEFKSNSGLSKHIVQIHKLLILKYYLNYILNSETSPKCPICGEDRKFRSLTDGFNKTCGKKDCVNLHTNKTNLNKYGTKNLFNNKDIINKSKQTMLERYGIDHYSKTSEYKEKFKQTCIKKYGVDNYSKTKEFKDKYKDLMNKKYGVDNYSKTDEFKEKTKNTCLKKYSTEHYSKTNEYKDRVKNTCIKKYGVDNSSKSEIVKNKLKATIFRKYGVKNSYLNTDSYKNIIRKYKLDILLKNIKLYRNDIEYIHDIECYKWDHNQIRKWKCLRCGETFEDYARATNNWLHPRCPVCNPIKYSSIENKVYNYLLEIGVNENDIIRNDRSIITPYELDLYIPSKALAIECDGTYWHSDEMMLEKYNMSYIEHKNLKLDLCKNKNIKLLHFIEDEINNEFDKIKIIIKEHL